MEIKGGFSSCTLDVVLHCVREGLGTRVSFSMEPNSTVRQGRSLTMSTLLQTSDITASSGLLAICQPPRTSSTSWHCGPTFMSQRISRTTTPPSWVSTNAVQRQGRGMPSSEGHMPTQLGRRAAVALVDVGEGQGRHRHLQEGAELGPCPAAALRLQAQLQQPVLPAAAGKVPSHRLVVPLVPASCKSRAARWRHRQPL